MLSTLTVLLEAPTPTSLERWWCIALETIDALRASSNYWQPFATFVSLSFLISLTGVGVLSNVMRRIWWSNLIYE